MAKRKKELSLEEKLEQALVPADEQPYEVPENWCWGKLKNFTEIITGKKDANYGKDGGEYFFFTCASEPIKCPDYSFDCSAILLAGNGDISNISRYDGKFEAYQRTYVVQTKENMNRDYLYFYFKYRWVDYNIDKMFGTAIPYIRLGNLNEFQVPIAPIEEQKRIVKVIESMFAKLDEAKEISEEIMERCKLEKNRFLDNILQGNSVWKKYKLIDLLNEKPRNGYSPKAVDYETPYKSMTLSATSSGVFKSEYCKYIDEEIEEDSYLWLNPGDILIQRANSIDKVGTNAIYTGMKHEFIYPDLMMKLRVKEKVSNRFISYYLKKSSIMNYFRARATGTAGNMPKINQGIVSDTLIKLPEYEEQEIIANKIDFFNAKYDDVIELSSECVRKIEKMKKSILAQAFRGELGTNIESEESSIELLKQILEVS